MKKFTTLLLEADDASKYTEVTDEVKKMINATIDKSGGEFKSFVESFIKNPDDVKIEGLINDSDIYDFIIKGTQKSVAEFVKMLGETK